MQAYLHKRASDAAVLDRLPADQQPRFPGLLYAEDFDAPPRPPPAPVAVAEPEPVIVEPTYSEADLAAARADGRSKGRMEADHGVAALHAKMLGEIARGLAEARADTRDAAAAAAEAVARTMLSALAACLPATCARHGEAEIRAVVRAVLPGLRDEPRIAVRVNPLMLPAMAEEIAALDAEVAAIVVVLPAEQLPPGDVRVTWQDGAAVRDTGRVRAAVADALAALGLLEKEMIDA
jgi:flagellar assembly protein FliH